MRAILGAVLVCLLGGCASSPAQLPAPVVAGGGNACPDPRPQVCTMEWAPVCASRVDSLTKTYASACNACADDQVVDYLDGECTP